MAQEEDGHTHQHQYLKWDTKYTGFSKSNNYHNAFKTFDTNLTNFHQFNQESKFENFLISIGNINAPYLNLAFENQLKIGFQTALFDFSKYSFSAENIAYFDTKTPFTMLFYAQGDNEMQQVNALHSRNITPWWNISFHFNASASAGAYRNQEIHNRHFYVSTNYKAKNNQYALFVSYIYNRFKQHCNGGISNPGFDSLSWQNRLVHSVLLNEAVQMYKNNSLNLHQYFKPDSLSKISLAHSLSFISSYYKYSDEDAANSYYRQFFLDSNVTDDSILWKLLENNVFFMNSTDNKLKLDFKAGLRHQSLLYQNRSLDSTMYYVAFFSAFEKKIKRYNLYLQTETALNGDLKGDYSYQAGFKRDDTALFVFQFGGVLAKQSAAMFHQFSDMNHLRWNNQFEKMTTQRLDLSVITKEYGLYFTASFNNITNYIFFNDAPEPVVNNTDIQVLSSDIRHLLTIGKFHLNHHLLIQYSSASDALPLPLWALKHQFYYESDLSNNKLKLQTGYSIFIHEKYAMPHYYAPANVFYVQNSTSTGFYPLTDIFLNLAIKRARIFVKTEQLHTFILLKNSWLMADYPVNPFSFKFGVSWLFYD